MSTQMNMLNALSNSTFRTSYNKPFTRLSLSSGIFFITCSKVRVIKSLTLDFLVRIPVKLKFYI